MEKHYADISTMFQEADDALFRTILSNRSHVLYTYLFERPEIAYSLRTRNHNKFLIPKTSYLGDRHFIVRSLYKNLYWCDFRIKLMCRYLRYLCHHSIFIVCIGVWTLYTQSRFIIAVSLLSFPVCRHSILLYLHVCVWTLYTVAFDNCF